nr:MAG TPA: hypothetical protein [Caudoviricetes sp.]
MLHITRYTLFCITLVNHLNQPSHSPQQLLIEQMFAYHPYYTCLYNIIEFYNQH